MNPEESIRLALLLETPALEMQRQRSRQRAQAATDPSYRSAHQQVADACDAELQKRRRAEPRWLSRLTDKDTTSWVTGR